MYASKPSTKRLRQKNYKFEANLGSKLRVDEMVQWVKNSLMQDVLSLNPRTQMKGENPLPVLPFELHTLGKNSPTSTHIHSHYNK